MQAEVMGTVVLKEHPSLSCPRTCSCLEDSFLLRGPAVLGLSLPMSPSPLWSGEHRLDLGGDGTARWGQSGVGHASPHATRGRATAAPALPHSPQENLGPFSSPAPLG